MESNIIDGKYEILEKIGSGGTSVVYKARRLSDGFIVAVKVTKEEMDDPATQRKNFAKEAEALSKMSHRNVRRIMAVGQWNGSLYMVTEYIDGRTLKDIILQDGPLDQRRALDYALQIAAGIEHAHLKHIIHRDIKSQNVIVANDGTVKLVDFGTARVLSQTTRTMGGKDVVGSVHYISPEQARGSHVDSRTDIYSFGVLLYEMFTGKLPFDGEEAVSIAMKHVNQMPLPPKSVKPDLPQGINDIIMKCLQKDPARRYQTASELREDLLLFAANPNGFSVILPKEDNYSVPQRYSESESEPIRRKNIPVQRASGTAGENGVKRRVAYLNDEDKKRVQAQKRKNRIILGTAIAASALVLIIVLSIIIPGTIGNGRYVKKAIPVVADLSRSAAVAVLKNESFSKLKFVEEFNSQTPADHVIRTSPEERTEVAVNTEITVYVSKGANQLMAENTIGKNYLEATSILEQQGFKVKYTYVADESKNTGEVIDQSSYNTAISEGASITLTVVRNITALEIVVPDLSGLSLDQARKKITEAGFKVGNYQEETTDDPNALGVSWQSVEPGKKYFYIEGENPPEVEIEFIVNVSSGYKCVYEYIVDEKYENSELELIVYNEAGEEIDYKRQTGSIISYEYKSKKEENITFELYNGNVRIDKRTLRTAMGSVNAD